ncbi:MAG: hypothetical protein JXR84_02500 [Anaerolineae bacterium]|nr:hypothetical protein [Anaerolineae bacterium]
MQIWQPYRGRTGQDWYRGTADAVYQNRSFIRDSGCHRVLILSGDQVYKQDYRPYLRREHLEQIFSEAQEIVAAAFTAAGL